MTAKLVLDAGADGLVLAVLDGRRELAAVPLDRAAVAWLRQALDDLEADLWGDVLLAELRARDDAYKALAKAQAKDSGLLRPRRPAGAPRDLRADLEAALRGLSAHEARGR